MDPQVMMKELVHCLEHKRQVVLVTVVTASGSTPSTAGTKMLVYADGSILGTIGGGALEARVIEEAKQSLKVGKPAFRTYSLDNQDAAGLGMVCGGEISVFLECFIALPELVIVGAGHIALDLAGLAELLNFNVTVIDDREEYANSARFPQADRLIVDDIENALADIEITANTYVAIMTRGHKYDQVALEKVICTEAAYIGMIGSRGKIKTVFGNLKEKGLSEATLDKVHAPIGLALGGSTPAEIALSIAAELVKTRYSRSVGDHG